MMYSSFPDVELMFYSTYSAFFNDFFIATVLCQREWAEAKKELQEERENVRRLTLDRDQTMKNSLRQVEDMSKELTNALGALASAESRAAVAEVFFWLLSFVCFIFFVIKCSTCKEKHWSLCTGKTLKYPETNGFHKWEGLFLLLLF